MYKPNKRHLQPQLISNVNELPEKRKRLKNSWAADFYHDSFNRIDVQDLEYPDHTGFPAGIPQPPGG
jgi:hypothetical protein